MLRNLFKIAVLFGLGIIGGIASAQTTTTYTGVIKDLGNNIVTSGQVNFTLAPSTDSTIPGTGRFSPSTISCTIQADGTLLSQSGGACTVTKNTALSPAGTSYRICIQPYYATPGSCFFDYATTDTKDISTIAPTLQTGPLNYNGIPGPPGCVIASTCTSALFPASVGGIIYADQCTGTEIGARITDCQSKLPLNSSGYRVGTIVLPNTLTEPAQATWATSVRLGPGVNLQGQGMFASSFNCTFAGDCLIHDASLTSTSPYQHTTLVNTVYQGFTITGNGSTGQNIMHWKDAQGVTLRDVALDGASSSTSACLWLEDVNWWTERNNFDNVSSLYNCKKAILMSAQVGNPYQPHPSFGYNNFSDWKANPNGSQYVLYMTGNPYFYSSTFNLTFNKEGAGAIIVHQDGGSEYYINETHIAGEDQGTGGYFLEQLSASNIFTYTGNILYGLTVQMNPASNPAAIFQSFGDAATFGPFLPHINNLDSQANFVQTLASGTDLNTVTKCGRYEVAAPINAPSTIGANKAHVEVFCSNSNFKSQNVYLYQASGGNTRQWQRIDDNAVWGAWREVAWVDRLPLVGTTGFLTSGPIAAGTCSNLTATVTGAISGMTVAATPAYALPTGTILNFGLQWDTAYVSNSNTVTVPVCNITASPISPAISPVFAVRVTQ